MAALTKKASYVTEFGGDYKVVVVEVDGTTSTNDTVTIDELSTVVGAVATIKGTQTAACCGVSVSCSTNVVTCVLSEADGTVCTQTPLDFYLVAIGY